MEVHLVNQSDASSKEISDLDVYYAGELIIAKELNDKTYNEYDVKHAMDKVIDSGGNKLLFIEGPHGKYISDTNINDVIKYYFKSGHHLKIISIMILSLYSIILLST